MYVLGHDISWHRIFKIRYRYFLTRNNRLRLRYIFAIAMIISLIGSFVTFSSNVSIAFSPVNISSDDVISATPSSEESVIAVFEQEGLPNYGLVEEAGLFDKSVSSVSDDVASMVDVNKDQEEQENIGDISSGANSLSDNSGASNDLLVERIIKINAGDTISAALQDAGLGGAQAYRVVKAISEYYDPRSVKPGQVISLYFDGVGENGESNLLKFSMKLSPVKELVVTRDKDGQRFSSKLNEKDVNLAIRAASISIDASLYGSAARYGIPAFIIAKFIKIYSYDVDFQRDIRRGDKVELLYEIYETSDGEFVKYGDILYANLTVRGREIPVYRYSDSNGFVDYYREDGSSLKRAIMQTPIDGARMSSGYGMRRHPVLGYNKMHKGVDFAASRGTPIYAAGNGVIEKAGRNGGYGNYIRIRHNNGLKTAYAHMYKFAKGIKVGKRVYQGEVIGYVGSTGRSTGPHLHFEVIKNGKQINPKSIKTSSGEKLKGRKLKDFQARILAVKQKYDVLAQEFEFAKNNQ